jgi:hypothetical protein
LLEHISLKIISIENLLKKEVTMFRDGRGCIEYADPTAQQEIRVKIAVDGEKPIDAQLRDLGVVETLAAEKFGAYLVDVL